MEVTQVMVVEDNHDTQQLIVRYLANKPDVEVVGVAQTGEEALYMLQRCRPDVLVLDIVLPELDGYAVMRKMRETGITNVRIMVLSSLKGDPHIRHAMDLGAYYFLTKPFNLDLLYDYIVQRDAFFDSALYSPMPTGPWDEDRLLDGLLGDLMGLPMDAIGTMSLSTAVRVAAAMDSFTGRITKEIYPSVGRLFGTTGAQVERAIRYSIEHAWAQGRMRDCGLFPPYNRPTNGEVIAVLARKLDTERRRHGRSRPVYH